MIIRLITIIMVAVALCLVDVSGMAFGADKTFTVQAGAFSSSHKALRLKETLIEKGFKAYLIKVEAGTQHLCKVSVSRYKTKTDAKRMSIELQAATGIAAFVTAYVHSPPLKSNTPDKPKPRNLTPIATAVPKILPLKGSPASSSSIAATTAPEQGLMSRSADPSATVITEYHTEIRDEGFGGSLDAGLEVAHWLPGRKEDGSMAYDTVTSYGLNLGMVLSYKRYPYFVANNMGVGSDISRGSVGAYLDPVTMNYFSDSPVLKRLLSLKLKYSLYEFSGSANATETFEYVPQSAVVDSAAMTITGSRTIDAGDSLPFVTEFESVEVSMYVMTLDVLKSNSFSTPHVEKENLRVGYFADKWTMPVELMATFSGNPVVAETTFYAQGVLLNFESIDPTAPGIATSNTLKFGFDGYASNAFNYEGVDISYFNIESNFWYNHYSNRNRAIGWHWRFGLDWELTGLAGTKRYTDANGKEQSYKVIDYGGAILIPYASASYRF